MILPPKGKVVSLRTIKEICISFCMLDLLDKIESNPPKRRFKPDG